MVDPALTALAERLQGLCLARQLTVAVAESCTGGLVAAALTTVPGSSGYFIGAVVSYADRAKVGLLGVPSEMIQAHGAVSAQVARAMATGARARLGVDLAAAVTGVAGPGGGTDAKPVGLTYVAVADARGEDVHRWVGSGDRATNRTASVALVIESLIERAQQVPETGA